jgi:hypothetical protein
MPLDISGPWFPRGIETVVARWSQTGAASAADVTEVATMSTQWSESSEYPEPE